MNTKRAPTIRSKLVLLVMACVVPACLVAILLITHDYQRARAQLLTNSLSTARAMVSVVDRDLASIESSLVALATSPYIGSGNFRAFYQQAQNVLQNQNSQGEMNIALLDITGKQYINTRSPFDTTLPTRNNFVGMQSIYETGKPLISDIFVGGVTKRPLLAVGVPVFDHGIRYNLNAGIFPERFERLLLQQKLPEGWIAVIFDGNGKIIARTRDMQRYSGQMAPPDMVKRLKAATEGTLERVTQDGISVHTVFIRSSVSNWSLALNIPKQSFKHELRETLFWLVFATFILLVISLAAAWWIGGRIAKSVHGLINPALALGAGDQVDIPPLHLREADEVGTSLMKASAMLQVAQHRANHDGLTGLVNRTLFNEIVNQQLLLCERNHTMLSILYIDLDGFKIINDKHGHETGDKLLCSVAVRLKAGSRSSDVVARLGGDEFAIVMVGTSMKNAKTVAETLVENVSEPYDLDGVTALVSASIGVAAYPDSGVTSEALLHRADRAMYKAKGLGRRRVETAPSE
ncbi:sensor domain-containing diguanylate cyclase [Herminiimonas fonticola]|uniref:Diguanylate cyclase (GGDEF)-like protein n=1 Tax=Herminiimonas fonticola TaxID=303380 RepID=A0A4R6G1I7_9BURK|nr:diguanylate cyclase [Herminiimonas fonticola]RBA23532.1 GGDEF: diguanylate cyclase (GGDEF) domain [Herminiimonas fonticola]TDN88213.1 diguanylate cyclase (GGDEF)-like protein [Herminiimonas fonticola]